ncbi:Vacuolar H+transporting two-sector ATPase F subunit [Petrotoga mexicana DSM 14811]|jgi:V/A-type H+-transporting ATPase subunit F|uniref:Vacuolar H+transporting two-sector ATPase F subunit n=3 Tax=Petrotoga TaxID=28236 RepID=A0A2K1PDA6_9BACT|nr:MULTISPECIES: V-type ATP synthase subunit F [Petrotoga]MDN5345636.1 V/A-type H+/Na+-transporting ATPase subunit [Petrotoga sp.]PNR99856.1 Vacuolar H+transporting two-sector ATPase F subunit [Petrotoga miotherma DSM 10691]PNS00774.1 Vacuolar H+transporting two-sector ATPase F subunit [Petrotoga mexicana DSM 14811]POZ93569.1 ATPase [Petrotoga halophila DSM 16923]
MKFFLISDNIDTAIGLRLSGIVGTVVHERDEILEAFNKALSNKEIGVVLITELASQKIPEEVKKHKLAGQLPLIFVIPDRHGWRGDKDFITKYVEGAIGVKINE